MKAETKQSDKRREGAAKGREEWRTGGGGGERGGKKEGVGFESRARNFCNVGKHETLKLSY